MESNDFVLLGGGFILGVLGYQLYKKNPDIFKNIAPNSNTQCPQGTVLTQVQCDKAPCPSQCVPIQKILGGYSPITPEQNNVQPIVPLVDAKKNIISMLDTKYGQSRDNVEWLEDKANKSGFYNDYINAWSSAIMRGESIFKVNTNAYKVETGEPL